jgi:hypothetical protein
MKLYYLTAFAITATLAASGDQCPAAQKIAGQKLDVLGIGIDSYTRAVGFQSSEKEVRDAIAAIAEKMCVPPSQITEIGRGTPPSRTNILVAYTAALQRMKPDHTLIFIFVGHGFAIDGVFYLVPQDAYFDEKSLESNRAASISLVTLIEIQRQYGRDVVFLVDGCRTFPIKLPGAKSTVLFATQEGQQSYEAGGHGLFLPPITARIRASGPIMLSEFLNMAQQATASVSAEGVGQRSTLVMDVPPGISAKTIRAASVADEGPANRQDALARGEFAVPAVHEVAWPEPLQPVFPIR